MKKSSMTQIDRNTQILSHIYNYCEKITKTIKRFSSSFDVFLNDSDYQDSVSMNLLQIGELVPKLSDDFIQCTSKSIPFSYKRKRQRWEKEQVVPEYKIIFKTPRRDQNLLKSKCSFFRAKWPTTLSSYFKGFTNKTLRRLSFII